MVTILFFFDCLPSKEDLTQRQEPGVLPSTYVSTSRVNCSLFFDCLPSGEYPTQRQEPGVLPSTFFFDCLHSGKVPTQRQEQGALPCKSIVTILLRCLPPL
jgi:hypothetical protein